MTPAERLRAFEDEKLGKDAPRLDGKVEKGHGSLFSRMTDADRALHGALEHLVETERRVAEKRTELADAEAAHADAEKKVADAEAAAAPPPAPAPEPAPAPANPPPAAAALAG